MRELHDECPSVGTDGSELARESTLLVGLDDDAAIRPEVVGGKAASLARAARAGFDVLPGVVLTTGFSAAIDAGVSVEGHPAVAEAFRLAGGDRRSLVARSSSVVEDTAASSRAGQFESVIGIDGLAELTTAIQVVLESRVRAGAEAEPIGVLIQPLLEAAYGGVLFGIDPVSGRSDRRVVSAVEGGPEPLVSGEVDGARYTLDASGHTIEHEQGDGPQLRRADLACLARLSARVADEFGSPQDVEWAVDAGGRLWLLQSRPVTTEVRGVPVGPTYGPGPVAETFPEPLTELEQDLWVPPLREAVRAAVLLAGTARRRAIAASEAVVAVQGHVAIDLKLAGEPAGRRSAWRRVSPVPGFHRLLGAWRVGRIRAALPGLVEHLLDRTDADLEALPPLPELSDRQLIALLHRSSAVLRALHAHEILMGALTDAAHSRMTGASVALRVLAEARQDGLNDDEIARHHPVVLALTAPRVGPGSPLPPAASALDTAPEGADGTDDGLLREALRLRVRWVQELSGRAAWELGLRLADAGDLPSPELVRHLSLEAVDAIATKRAVLVPALVQAHRHDFGAPLPARFQLSDTGHAIRAPLDRDVGGGTGAGGGTGRGPVTFDAACPPQGSVLVTTTLTPGLGPLLSRLEGIVAETGSVLSHLAILAREAGVATVVGYAGAADDLPEGTVVSVDGETGRVTVEREGPAA